MLFVHLPSRQLARLLSGEQSLFCVQPVTITGKPLEDDEELEEEDVDELLEEPLEEDEEEPEEDDELLEEPLEEDEEEPEEDDELLEEPLEEDEEEPDEDDGTQEPKTVAPSPLAQAGAPREHIFAGCVAGH